MREDWGCVGRDGEEMEAGDLQREDEGDALDTTVPGMRNEKNQEEADTVHAKRPCFLFNVYLFIWLCQVLAVACGIFSCGM